MPNILDELMDIKCDSIEITATKAFYTDDIEWKAVFHIYKNNRKISFHCSSFEELMGKINEYSFY